MKKLFLTVAIATTCIASIQAQPVAGDAYFTVSTGYPFYNNNLTPLVQGGTPPYEFNLQQVDNTNPGINVDIEENGNFYVTVPTVNFGDNVQFQYTATDSTNNVSNPGTVIIKFGQEKG